LIEILAELGRVDWWQLGPAVDESTSRGGRSAQGPQLGDAVPIAGDRKRLAPDNALDDLSAVVAQFSDRHFGHKIIVSRVRHQVSQATQQKGRRSDQVRRYSTGGRTFGGREVMPFL
jgi:hypothetical protein